MFKFSDYIGYAVDCADGNLYFKDVTLKKQIGDFPVGSKFDHVEFYGESMELVFYDDKNNVIMYRNFSLIDIPMEN